MSSGSPQPTLPVGSPLGPYEIVAPLGAGGMGEVYQARDSRLGRLVAIKVLPADRMTDANRRRRFAQEARAASALNHPNIVTIYEIESADGIDFIVMEYVPGRPLEALISSRGLPLREALPIAVKIADGLAQAHAHGIVHRDLTPANVIVGPEGVVKVLDFGLAKLVGDAGDEVGTSSGIEKTTLTGDGVVAGTAGFMSPEQAQGQAVDARSDVFSFGAVLYQMVTGRRAFLGASRAETLQAVVHEQPPTASGVSPAVPPALDRVIQRCLRKEPERRYQHMLDAKVELLEIKEETESGGEKVLRPPPPWRRRVVVAAMALALAGALAFVGRKPQEAPPPAPRLLPPLTALRGFVPAASLSPDGTQVAFPWNGENADGKFHMYVKEVGSTEMRRLTNDAASDFMPAWSPDGRQLAFVRFDKEGGRVHLISPIAGSERKLSDFPVYFSGLAWTPDSRWLAAIRGVPSTDGPGKAGGIYLLPVDGAEPQPVPIPEEKGAITSVWIAPDGRHLAYTANVAYGSYICVVDLDSAYHRVGAPRRITRRRVFDDAGGAFSRDGKSFLYGEWGIPRLWRVEISGDRPPAPVELAGFGAHRPATASRSDRLVFVQEPVNKGIYQFQPGQPEKAVVTSSLGASDPDFSPDGRQIAYSTPQSGVLEIWVADADGSRPRQLTHGPGFSQGWPSWSPDGHRIAFQSRAEDGSLGISTIGADGASPRRLTAGPDDAVAPAWSQDSRFVYFVRVPTEQPTSESEVWRVAAEGGTPERITRGHGGTPHESLDGRTLYYMTHVLESSPLFAQPLSEGDARELAPGLCALDFVVRATGLYSLECGPDRDSAPVLLRDPTTGQGRLVGKLAGASGRFAVSPDGKTVLYTRSGEGGSDLMMIDNFR